MIMRRIDTGTDYRVVYVLEVPLWFQFWMANLGRTNQ